MQTRKTASIVRHRLLVNKIAKGLSRLDAGKWADANLNDGIKRFQKSIAKPDATLDQAFADLKTWAQS